MSTLDVSVILPVYNAETYLREAIESVLEQTQKADEFIVVDDGSTDASAEIVASYGDAIRYIFQENHGAAHARNQGLEIAAGHVVAFIDADDVWVKDKLERQMRHLTDNPSVDYSTGKIRHFLEEGKAIPKGFKEELLTQDVDGRLLGTLLARRSVFDRVGKFDPTLRVAHDVDWFVRAEELDISRAALDDVLMLKRVHVDNISNSAEVNTKELLSLFRKSLKRRK